MPHGAEEPLDEQDDEEGRAKTEPELRVIPGGKDAGFYLPDEPDLSPEALARAQGLEPVPAPSPEHNEATPESLLNSPYLRAARAQLVSAWADLRKYEHGLIGTAIGIVARKSKETARVRYEAAKQAYEQALREQAQEVEREFGAIEKAKALVSAMEQVTDARAEHVLADMGHESLRKLYQLWQKMGEMNVGNIEAVKNILARQEDDSVWKGKAKMVGRFIARGMSLRSAVGAAMVGSGFWLAYAGWRGASAAAGGAATHTLMREGLRAGSRELLAGSESKVRREYSEVELARMDDKELGGLLQAYGARLGFHGEKLQGNAQFERVRDAFLSRLAAVKENVEEREAEFEPAEEDVLEAVTARRDAMLSKLEDLSVSVEEELAKKETEDRRQRLIAAASALAISGAIMYWRGGSGGGVDAESARPIVRVAPVEPEIIPEPSTVEETAPVEMSPKLMRDAFGHAPEQTVAVEPAAFAEAPAPPTGEPVVPEAVAPVEAVPVSPVELPHGIQGVYEIKQGQGLLHAANEFQKSQHDAIVAGVKTQHPEWFAKGEDYAIRQWRMEQVRDHGGDIMAAGEKYTETLHPGAKIQLEFDDTGYPHLTSIEDKNITHHAEHLRPRAPETPAPKPELGFEKWGDNHPIRFSKDGVSGTLVPHGEDELGEFTLDIRDIHVDDRVVNRFLDPHFKQALAERFNVGDDPAALAVLEERAHELGRELAAREAAREYLSEHGAGSPAMAQELAREIDKTIQKAHWQFEDAQVFRPVSMSPKEAAAADIAAPLKPYAELYATGEGVGGASIRFPESWTSAQQEAARRLFTYHEGYVKELERQYETYLKESGSGPDAARLRDAVDTAREDLLTDGEHSTRAILRRLDKGEPLGDVPTIGLAAGKSTIEETMVEDARQSFKLWAEGPATAANK